MSDGAEVSTFLVCDRRIVGRMCSWNCGRSDCRSRSDDLIGGGSRCGTCIGGAWCMEEADWWICDCSGTRFCCQCTFDETTGFYYLWNLCGYWSCVCIAFY